MKNKLLKLSLALFLVILLASLAQGIAVSPSKKIIDFIPGSEEEVTFSIINIYHEALKALGYVSGALGNYSDL